MDQTLFDFNELLQDYVSLIGNFKPGDENGTIIKKSSPDEAKALQRLMDDIARPFVPEFKRQYTENSECILKYTLITTYVLISG